MSDERGARREARGADDRFDLAIDRAVRGLLDVEQPAGFRRRVLRRIESGDSRSSAAFPFHTVVSAFRQKTIWVPLAAAAILVLALVLPRSAGQPQKPASVAQTAPPSAPVVVQGRSLEAPKPPSSVGTFEVRPIRRPVANAPSERTVAAASTPAEPVQSDIDPLKAIAPIHVAPIAQSTIAMADISVRPLNAISDVQIAPLNPPDRRN